MNPAPYRSTQSVPARVDRAWQLGFEAGQRDARRLAGLMLIVGLFVELRRRHRFHVLPALLVTLTVAAVTVPIVVAFLVIRWGWRVHRRRRGFRRPGGGGVVGFSNDDDWLDQ